MTERTLNSWLSANPVEVRHFFGLPLSNGQEFVLEALDSKGKKPLELILRSIYDSNYLIAQRFYYLQNYAKSNTEKTLCIQKNTQDIYAMIEEDKNKDKFNPESIYKNVLLYLHILHTGEILWSMPNLRDQSEIFWFLYHKNSPFDTLFDLKSILLYRYPLFKKPQEFDIDVLLSPTEDIALRTYAKALYFFSENPSSEKAQSLLQKSIKLNPHLPSLLLQKKRIPKKSPMEFEPGQISEAKYIAYISGETWWSVKDAISWLRKNS